MVEAFYALSTDRPYHSAGLGAMPGPIPWSVIDRYAERYGIEDFEEFEILIRGADNGWLEWHSERMKNANGGRKRR